MSRVASARQRSSSRFIARVLLGAKPAPFPGFIEPALATPRIKIPTGARFVHELKLDGYRVQAHLLDGRVRLYTRSGSRLDKSVSHDSHGRRATTGGQARHGWGSHFRGRQGTSELFRPARRPQARSPPPHGG